jgi:hypothetical protein
MILIPTIFEATYASYSSQDHHKIPAAMETRTNNYHVGITSIKDINIIILLEHLFLQSFHQKTNIVLL